MMACCCGSGVTAPLSMYGGQAVGQQEGGREGVTHALPTPQQTPGAATGEALPRGESPTLSRKCGYGACGCAA